MVIKYAKLGNNDIKVSKLCVGCMSFGVSSEDFHSWTLGYEESSAMVKKALGLGINFFDTANVYSHAYRPLAAGKLSGRERKTVSKRKPDRLSQAYYLTRSSSGSAFAVERRGHAADA